MRLINHIKLHGKAVKLHLKRHHKKYIFGILSVSLLVKGISLIVAHTLVHNLSFADIITGDDNGSIIDAEFDDNELTENLDGLTDGSDTKINSENIEGGNLEEPENSTDSEEPIVSEDPEEPENSTDSEEPIISENLEDPENSTAPEEPIVSENPEEPENPTDSEEPIISEDLEEPENSTDSEEPIVSEDPEEPENSTDSEEPIVDENPEEPTADENSDDFVATRGLVSPENMSEELEQDDEYIEDENEDDYIEDDLFDDEWDDDFGEEIEKNTTKNNGNISGDLTTREKAFQEVAYAYYMRGPYLHYNASKSLSDILSPEESTSQDYHYMTCAPYIVNVYKELLGIVLTSVDYHYRDYAKDFVGVRPEVIGYGEKSGNKLLWTYGIEKPEGCEVENPTQSCIIKQLKIGDVLYYAGHVMLVYDYVFDDDGNIDDVYLMHSWQAKYLTNTKTDHGTEKYYNKTGGIEKMMSYLYVSQRSKLGFNYRVRTGMYEDVGSRSIEGTVILQTLKEKASADGTLSFGSKGTGYSPYAILRFVTSDDSGNSVLNFNGQWTGGDNYNTKKFNYYNFLGLGKGTGILYEVDNTPKKFDNLIIKYSDSVKSRLTYTKLYIEKTVDKKDNNIVEPGDVLTYNIVIKNESNRNYETGLLVTEYIDTDLVEYIGTSTDNVELNGNQLQWNIGILGSKTGKTIEYKVKVKTGHIGEIIESTGLVGNIPSGIVKNKIGKNLKEEYSNGIVNEYEKLKTGGYTGKILVNEIYKKAYGVDLGLNSFIMTGYISGDVIIQGQSGLILYNKKGSVGWNPAIHGKMCINSGSMFSGMVLNNYFNTLYRKRGNVSIDNINVILYEVPALWPYMNPDNRANTIFPSDFQTGDILIYINGNDVKYYSTGPVVTITGEDGNVYTGKTTITNPITYEDGEYAYIYINGKFIGVNQGNNLGNDLTGTRDDRNEFTRQYYDDNNLSGYATRMLFHDNNYELLNSGGFTEWLQYQSLFGKEAYVVLRPSLVIRDIVYELDGGINNDDNPRAFILSSDIELKEPTKIGYVFSGWYTDSEYTNQVTNISELTDDVVLYAKWMSSCTFQGINMAHGNSLTVYSAGSTTCPATCITGTVTCNNGTVLGNTEYSNLSCSPLPVPCDTDFTLTSTGSHGIYESCIPYTVSNNSCTPGITVYKLTNCANGYHTENDSGCISNTKMVSCTQSGKPENSSYVTGNVQVTWNGERNNGGWSTADNCGWTCDSGYTQVGNVCRPELTTREKAFQEVAYAYYMRGPYIHYNSARGRGHDFSPEEATSQDYNYLACGLYVLNVYRELLGNFITFPYHGGQNAYAKKYVGKRPEVIGYGEKTGGNLYWWDGTTQYLQAPKIINPTKNDIIKQLQIGDIFGYDGHVTMVYDYKYNENGDKEDVYLIHATDSPQYRVYSKMNLGATVYDNSGNSYDLSIGHNKWSAIRYNIIDRRTQPDPHSDARVEGTVRLNAMSLGSSVLKFNTGNYSSHYYILRFVTDDGLGNSMLSINGTGLAGYRDCSTCSYTYYSGQVNYSDSIQSRLKYNKLYIEKTVNKRDNTIVGVGDELTYTIRIQNNSDQAYDDDLIIKENINTDLVENLSLYSYEKNGTQIQEIQLLNDGNQLQWNIGKLNSGDEVIIQYTVKVRPGNIGETIESTGMAGGIPSGIVTNTIGRNTDKGENLKIAYNDFKDDFTGKYLINEIYKDVYGVDLGIDKIAKLNTADHSDTGALIYYNNKWGSRSNNWDSVEMQINRKSPYSGMILNGYFNVLYKDSNDIYAADGSGGEIAVSRYGFPAIAVKSNDIDKRADTIFPSNFQTGDILIYKNSDDAYYNWSSYYNRAYVSHINTYENGEYAYIYIDGKFVGVNLGNDLTGTGDDRNEFITGYYSNAGIDSRYYTDSGVGVPQNIPGGFNNWLHYQTLFGKDVYVVLRPSLMIRNISYELNGGTGNDENPSAFILGRDVELQNPTKSGFTFQGWYTDSEYTNQVTNISEFTDDVVLYAKWKNSTCTFNGNTINHGESVTGYRSSTVPYGSTCESEIRTCVNGELSGTYQYGSCTVQQPGSCTFNGNTINHGESVTGYRSSTVPYGSTCESEIRTCRNGELSGTYQYGSCTVQKRGKGGGVKLKKDNCPDGDFSDSYYDGICEDKPIDKTGMSHNSANDIYYDISNFDQKYSDEMNKAYQYAYHYGITTRDTIEDANMNGNLTRIAMAKMLSQYAINVLGMEPDNTRQNIFTDVSSKLDSDYYNGVTLAYQLGIMGINIGNNFRPYDIVTRAEFVTALSRLLYGTKDGSDKYYSTHMAKLYNEGIITKTDPNMKELRGYVMLMFMRSTNK